jgi:hypothetical protein
MTARIYMAHCQTLDEERRHLANMIDELFALLEHDSSIIVHW